MDKQLKSELVHLLVTYCSAINNLEEYLARLIEKESVELFSFNKEYIKTIWKVSDYKCSTCDLGKWSHTSEGPSDARQQRAVCKLCQSLYDRITDKHALKSPNWANVEWQLIMIEPLQHMKCYIKEYGHREVRMVRQLGLSALIQICLNHCDLKTLFGNALPFLEQISEKQDQVFQSETLHIGEDDLNTHLRKIEDVLKIVCGGTDMDITSHTMSAKIFNAGQQQFTVEDELKTKLKIIQTLDRRIHSLKCWQTLYGNSQDDQELQKLLFIKNLHCQKLQERNQQLASNTHGKIQRYEKQKQVLKNYTDEINKISTDNSSHYCESGMMSDLTVQSPHDKYNQTLLEETHDNVIEALENTHTNKNGIETAICLLRDIHDKFDACSAGIFLVPGTSKEEGFRSVAQTDSKSYLDSRKIIRNINRPMETDTPGEVSTTTKARLIQSPSGLNTQEPVNGQKRSLKRPYQCLESECPKVTVTPNLQAIRTESPNSFNSTETVPEHISLLERPLQYLEEGGNTICRINHECMAFYLSCPNVLNVINLCEDVLNGKVEALFLPLQNYLRTQPDCNNVSVVVDISGNDFTKCIMPCLIKLNRQLDSRIQQLENPYKQNNKASTAAGNTDMKTAISMFKDLIDHHPSVNCETPSELRLTVDTLGVEDSHTLTRHLVDAANELQRYKKNVKYRETLQNTDQHEKNGIETAISIFKELKGHIPFIDETSELRLKVEVIGVKDGHSLTRQIFHTAIELQSTEESITSNSQELRQYLQHVVQYLKKDGNTLNIRETDCSAFYICCPTLANAMTLCEDCITGKVEALFQPLQSYLKTLPECQDVSIVVDISENDFVNCILPSLTAIKRLLESCVPAQGPDSRGSVAVSKYADKGIESCTSNKQVSSFDDQFSVHPWDRLISQLCEEFSVEDSDFENILLGSKTRIGDDNYNRIQSLDGRSGQKYHAFFDCLERKFGQHDSVEFLLHLIATLNFHSNSACVTYTTAFEQYKQDIEELHLTTKGLVMEPSCKIVDILQKRPEENVSSYERHPKGVVLWGPLGMGMTRFLNQILWRLRFGSFTTSIVRQWNIVAVNQRDKTEVKELSSNMINNIRKEMGMQDIICDLISVNDQKQNLMTLLKDLGKRKGDYLVLLDDMDGHFKNEHSPCEQFLTDVMDTIAEVDNIKIILTVSKSVSKSNVIDSFGGKLVFGGHMLEFNLTEEILTENIPTEEILMPKISCLEDQLQNDRLSLDDLDKLLIKANQTIIQATEAGSRFSEESERTIHKDLNTFEATKQAGKDRIENQTQAGEKRIEIKIQESIKLINRTVIEKEQDEYERGVSDLLKRLVNHYRDTVCYVPQSTLDPSLDKHVQDVYSTPKIHNMKIENDGRRTKQELILTYRDCFYRGDHLSRRTYLQGEPGSGKTSFAAKLVHDWCNVYEPLTESKEQTAFGDVDTLHKFKFFFFISLRDSREQTHVTHMIQTQLIYKIYAADEWESAYNLVLKIMRNVMYLVVQDGLDEWPGKEALPSMDGIPKDHCIVLTTSRPWKLADERIKNSQIDILLEVYGIIDSEGFSERILRHHLDETKDLNKTVYQFQEFLESRDLISISSSPMLHTLVLCAWVDDMAESLTGSSLCELYTTLLENLCKKCNPQMSYFDQHHQSPVNCFSRTKYVKPNMVHIDAIAKAAFAFLFSNEKEQSLVFSDINLSVHLSESTKQFALHSGLISKRKSIKCYDNTSSFVHKTVQEFFAALHISNNTDVIDNVTCEYLKSNRDSYLDISQVFIFLCGFNILAANKLSALMNQVEDDRHGFDHYVFQSVILSGYREAVANKNTPIDLHLSHFHVWRDNAEDLINIFALNAPRARSLHVFFIDATIRSQDASSSLCQGPISLPARDNADPSTRAKQKEVRSSASCLEFDFSACHNLEQLKLEGDITVLPNALVGLKKLKYLTMNIGCKCEALDMSHYEHIESIELGEGVTLLPHCITKYKNLKYIKIHSVYKELDLSMFENLNSITISKQVQVLPKQLLIHNNQKLKYIGLHEFDFNRCDKKDIHTWCLLNGADPVLCADYTPVLPSIKHIQLSGVTCSSTWLRSLLTTLFTLDHRVKCSLEACDITKLDHVKPSLKHVYGESCINVCITTDLNNTCQLDVAQDCPGLWETLLGLSVKNLSLSNGSYYFRKLKAYHDSPLSWSLVQLSQLETLRMHLSEYIDLLLPLSLDHVTVCFDTLNPSELRQLVNKLSAWTHSLECRFELCCGYYKDTGIMHIIPSEEYIPIQQELEAMQHVDVKRFRIYDWTTSTSEWSERDSVVDDGDHGDEIVDEQFCADFYRTNRDGLSRISIRLKINCA